MEALALSSSGAQAILSQPLSPPWVHSGAMPGPESAQFPSVLPPMSGKQLPRIPRRCSASIQMDSEPNAIASDGNRVAIQAQKKTQTVPLNGLPASISHPQV